MSSFSSSSSSSSFSCMVNNTEKCPFPFYVINQNVCYLALIFCVRLFSPDKVDSGAIRTIFALNKLAITDRMLFRHWSNFFYFLPANSFGFGGQWHIHINIRRITTAAALLHMKQLPCTITSSEKIEPFSMYLELTFFFCHFSLSLALILLFFSLSFSFSFSSSLSLRLEFSDEIFWPLVISSLAESAWSTKSRHATTKRSMFLNRFLLPTKIPHCSVAH